MVETSGAQPGVPALQGGAFLLLQGGVNVGRTDPGQLVVQQELPYLMLDAQVGPTGARDLAQVVRRCPVTVSAQSAWLDGP